MTTADKEAAFEIRVHGCQCGEAPRSPLFSIIDESPDPVAVQRDDGTTRYPTITYTAPEYFETHVGLDYLEIFLTSGSDFALRWAIVQAVGIDGWNALRTPGVDYDTFADVCAEILRRVKGSTKGPKAK